MEYTWIKSQLVESPVDAGTTKTKITFPTQNFLRLKQICAIEIFTSLDCSIAPSQNAVFTAAVLKTGFLTLYGENPEAPDAMGEWMQQIPLMALHRINNFVDPYVEYLWNMLPRNIVWEKSYVELGTAVTPDVDTSFLFQVSYSGNEGDN